VCKERVFGQPDNTMRNWVTTSRGTKIPSNRCDCGPMNERAAKQWFVLPIKLSLESAYAPDFDHPIHLRKPQHICISARMTTTIESLPHQLQPRGMSGGTPRMSRPRNGPRSGHPRGQWYTGPFPTPFSPMVVSHEVHRLCLDRYLGSKKDSQRSPHHQGAYRDRKFSPSDLKKWCRHRKVLGGERRWR
jgi:hypothetical protein